MCQENRSRHMLSFFILDNDSADWATSYAYRYGYRNGYEAGNVFNTV